jgi:hypothetical protein
VLLAFPKAPSDPIRISPGIQNAKHDYFIPGDTVVNAEGEPLHHEPMVSKTDGMNPCIKSQGIDLREKRVEKVITDAIGLPFVELPCRSEIL